MIRALLKLSVTSLLAEWYEATSCGMTDLEKVQTIQDLQTSLKEIANNELPSWLPRKEK